MSVDEEVIEISEISPLIEEKKGDENEILEEEEILFNFVSAGIEIPEIVFNILKFCELGIIGKLIQTSKSFYRVGTDDRFWKFVFENNGPSKYSLIYEKKIRSSPIKNKKIYWREDESTLKSDIFPKFRERANNLRIEAFRRNKIIERTRKRRERSARNLEKWPTFLKYLSIIFPQAATLLSFHFLYFYSEENDVDEENDEPIPIVQGIMSYLLCPCAPQFHETLCICVCSSILQCCCCCCCCFSCVLSSLCSLLGVLRFQSRHSLYSTRDLFNYYEPEYISQVLICFFNPVEIFCCPIEFLFGCVFIFLFFFCRWLMGNDDANENYSITIFIILFGVFFVPFYACRRVFGDRGFYGKYGGEEVEDFT